jgi:hypothetical protein
VCVCVRERERERETRLTSNLRPSRGEATRGKVKVSFTVEQARNAQRRSRGIALLFL